MPAKLTRAASPRAQPKLCSIGTMNTDMPLIIAPMDTASSSAAARTINQR